MPSSRSLVNSAVVAVLQTAGQLLLARWRATGWRGSRTAAPTGLLRDPRDADDPAAVTFVPSYVRRLHARLGQHACGGSSSPVLFSAFATFLFRQYYLDFPGELEEAARMDGLGYFGALLAGRGAELAGFFAALGVIAFIASWNRSSGRW